MRFQQDPVDAAEDPVDAAEEDPQRQ